jgi:hypothetical protein
LRFDLAHAPQDLLLLLLLLLPPPPLSNDVAGVAIGVIPHTYVEETDRPLNVRASFMSEPAPYLR